MSFTRVKKAAQGENVHGIMGSGERSGQMVRDMSGKKQIGDKTVWYTDEQTYGSRKYGNLLVID